MARDPMSVRLTDDARKLLADLSAALGIGKSDVIELAIREKAERHYGEDVWAYTPEHLASVKRAQSQPAFAIRPDELAAIIDASDQQAAVQALIAKHLHE